MTHDLQRIFTQLDANCIQHDYAGYDPFDGLNSRLFQATPLKYSRLARLAWLQAFKRSPINLRGITAVPRTHNAKALALFARSYIMAGKHQQAIHCLTLLLDLRNDDGGWGYPFDWQARAFFVPKGTSNVICTAYAVLAIQAAHQAGLCDDAERYINEAAQFVTTSLLRDDYIAYIPSSDAFVHNASLWGAAICALSNDNASQEISRRVIASTLHMQGGQGEWAYGTLPHHSFIDSFHTGYNLEALYRSNMVLQQDDITQAITKGMAYYTSQFIDDAGNVGYYHNNPYPYDPHAAAQAILTLALIEPESHALQRNIMDACIIRMWNNKHCHFHYQHWKHYKNKQSYIRWTQAWMHLALSAILSK